MLTLALGDAAEGGEGGSVDERVARDEEDVSDEKKDSHSESKSS